MGLGRQAAGGGAHLVERKAHADPHNRRARRGRAAARRARPVRRFRAPAPGTSIAADPRGERVRARRPRRGARRARSSERACRAAAADPASDCGEAARRAGASRAVSRPRSSRPARSSQAAACSTTPAMSSSISVCTAPEPGCRALRSRPTAAADQRPRGRSDRRGRCRRAARPVRARRSRTKVRPARLTRSLVTTVAVISRRSGWVGDLRREPLAQRRREIAAQLVGKLRRVGQVGGEQLVRRAPSWHRRAAPPARGGSAPGAPRRGSPRSRRRAGIRARGRAGRRVSSSRISRAWRSSAAAPRASATDSASPCR